MIRLSFLFLLMFSLVHCKNSKPTVDFTVTEINGIKKSIEPKEKGFVFLFVAPDCPFCLGSSAEFNDMNKKFGNLFTVVGVIPGNLYTAAERDEYVKGYNINFPVVFDINYDLKRKLGATVTPEAFVVSPGGSIIYKGAINDKPFDAGKSKVAASDFYVLNVVKALANGEQVTQKSVQAHGCFIE